MGLFVSVSTFEDTSRLEDSSLSDLFDERRDLRFEDFSLRLDFVDDDRLELIILREQFFQERNGKAHRKRLLNNSRRREERG